MAKPIHNYRYTFEGISDDLNNIVDPYHSKGMDKTWSTGGSLSVLTFLQKWAGHIGEERLCRWLGVPDLYSLVTSVPKDYTSEGEQLYVVDGVVLDTIPKFFSKFGWRLNASGCFDEYDPECIFLHAGEYPVESSLSCLSFDDTASLEGWAGENQNLKKLLYLTFYDFKHLGWWDEHRSYSLRELKDAIEVLPPEEQLEVSFQWPRVTLGSEKTRLWNEGLERNLSYSKDITPYVDMFKGSGLYMGLEIEMSYKDGRKEILKSLGRGYCLPKADSSISAPGYDYSMELVTGALGLDIHRKKLSKLFRWMRENPRAVCDTARNNNGLHINLGKAQVNEKDKMCGHKMRVFFAHKDNHSFLSKISQRPYTDQSYAPLKEMGVKQFACYTRVSNKRGKGFRKFKEQATFDKYSAFHDTKRHIYEIRLFKGVMTPEHIFGALEFVVALQQFASTHSMYSMSYQYFLFWLDKQERNKWMFLRNMVQDFKDRKPITILVKPTQDDGATKDSPLTKLMQHWEQ